MDKQRLIMGLSVLLLLVGAGLACFTPGGLFNRMQSVPIFGAIPVQPSRCPMVGYVLLTLAAR